MGKNVEHWLNDSVTKIGHYTDATVTEDTEDKYLPHGIYCMPDYLNSQGPSTL